MASALFKDYDTPLVINACLSRTLANKRIEQAKKAGGLAAGYTMQGTFEQMFSCNADEVLFCNSDSKKNSHGNRGVSGIPCIANLNGVFTEPEMQAYDNGDGLGGRGSFHHIPNGQHLTVLGLAQVGKVWNGSSDKAIAVRKSGIAQMRNTGERVIYAGDFVTAYPLTTSVQQQLQKDTKVNKAVPGIRRIEDNDDLVTNYRFVLGRAYTTAAPGEYVKLLVGI